MNLLGHLTRSIFDRYAIVWERLLEEATKPHNTLPANGGGGIRTRTSFRTPVFKTGALAVLPPLRTTKR